MSTKEKTTLNSKMRRLTQRGREIISNIPKTISVKIRRPVDDHERFRRWLDAESKLAAVKGTDTYEEFMYFGVDEDEVPSSQFEVVFDPRTGREMYTHEKQWLDAQRAEYDKAQRQKRDEARRFRKQMEREAHLDEEPQPMAPMVPQKKTKKTDPAE